MNKFIGIVQAMKLGFWFTQCATMSNSSYVCTCYVVSIPLHNSLIKIQLTDVWKWKNVRRRIIQIRKIWIINLTLNILLILFNNICLIFFSFFSVTTLSIQTCFCSRFLSLSFSLRSLLMRRIRVRSRTNREKVSHQFLFCLHFRDVGLYSRFLQLRYT